MAAMQGFRGPVERWGGRGSRGGASELLGEVRGGRSQWLRRTAATMAFGRSRERETEEGVTTARGWRRWRQPWRGSAREREGAARERERDKARGSGRHREEAPRRRAGEGGRQTSWWRGAPAVRARRPHAWPTGARRTTAVVGWAGLLGRPAGWAAQGGAQVSSSCYLFFCFLISDICFDLKKIY